MRVLIVDDSAVFRSQIRAALEGVALIEVAGAANNGRIALQRLAQSSVDLVTLDMEMPEMGGLETIREIRKLKYPVRIVVFSSGTTRGSQMALEALALGADDFVAKPQGSELSMGSAAESIRADLLPKILQFTKAQPEPLRPIILQTCKAVTQVVTTPLNDKKVLATFLPSVIVIGSSTGGPPALEKVLSDLRGPIRCPILIAQHMPPVFTESLAKRLEGISGIKAEEGKNGEELLPNRIYVAPGNFHMLIEKGPLGFRIRLNQAPQRNSVRPAVDYLFESAAACFGPKCMGIVLTGMGEDGMLGCSAIKHTGGGVMIQDKESSVVFGMPGAVFQRGCFDEIGSLESIHAQIRRMSG